MKKIFTYLGIVFSVWITTQNAPAQKATELFIPIGKSPGISGKCSMMGTIDSVDTSEHVVYMHDSTGYGYDVEIGDKTKIYLDKSGLKQRNELGSIADCDEGAYCEVLYESRTRKKSGEAEWIKIRVTADMEK
jgi:hypothetical protein